MNWCEECGSDLLEERKFGEAVVLECAMCGELHGDDELVSVLIRERSAREQGLDLPMFELREELLEIPGISVDRVEAGDLDSGTWPTLFFHATREGMAWLEPLVKSVTLALSETTLRWTLEVQYQRCMEFLLRPRFIGKEGRVTSAELTSARDDLGVLARGLRRDKRSSWWRPAFRAKAFTG